MKITLVTCGSRGDVQPMLTLALALKSKGHEIRLLAPPENVGWVRNYGCRFQPLGTNAMAVIMNRAHVHSLKSALDFARYLYNELDIQLDSLPGMIQGSDLVMGTGLVLGLPTAAEFLGIPYRFIALTPQLFPSREHPFPVFREQWFPSVVNQLTWVLANSLDRFFLRARLNAWRRQKGLKPVNHNMRHLLGHDTIVACDRELATVPRDTEIGAVQTGYMHLEQRYIRNPELERFLDQGSPPVFAGFGSMQGRDQKEVMRLIIKTAGQTGKRVIFSHSRGGPGTTQINEECLFVENIPHRQFFPYLSAVIHHGGSGTTAMAALNGIPQVIVPHVLDQFYWAERIRKLGLGPRPTWRSRLSGRRLASAIDEACSSRKMKQRAVLTGQSIQQRDSIALTVEHIKSIMNRDRP